MMNVRLRCSILAVPLLAALGCSDPVPLPAQAAMTLSIQKSMSSCPDSGTTYAFGAVKDKVIQSPTANNHGQSVVNGDQGSTISCSVKKASDGSYAFSGSVKGTANGDQVVTVTFNNGVIGADLKGSASLYVFTRVFSQSYSTPGDKPCTFNVVNNQLKNGALWATFSCPALTAAPDSECAVGSTSTIVFENCDGS